MIKEIANEVDYRIKTRIKQIKKKNLKLRTIIITLCDDKWQIWSDDWTKIYVAYAKHTSCKIKKKMTKLKTKIK